jgi:hypothetical protein
MWRYVSLYTNRDWGSRGSRFGTEILKAVYLELINLANENYVTRAVQTHHQRYQSSSLALTATSQNTLSDAIDCSWNILSRELSILITITRA